MTAIDEMLLISGQDYQVNEKITVKHPTLKEILQFGEKKYLDAISLFCTTPEDLMVELDDFGIDYEELSNWDIFLLLCQNETLRERMSFFLCNSKFELAQNPNLFLIDFKTQAIIDRLAYEQISSFIRKINYIPERKVKKTGNKFTKKLIIEEKRLEQKKKEKGLNDKPSYFTNLITSVVWGNTSNYNFSNIWDLKLYQFYSGVNKLQQINNYNHVMNGVYNGTVNTKDIDFEKLNWI